jgi:HK97 gp10 family phage protein
MAGNIRLQHNDRALHKLFAGQDGPVAAHIERICLRIERRAKQLCPVDTGRLRSSISTAIIVDGRSISGIVGTNVEYAPYVEFGTSRMEAQPYLRPAFYAVTGTTATGGG